MRVFVFGMFCFGLNLLGQVVTVTPEQLKTGDTVVITYNPTAEGATLGQGETVKASVTFYGPNLELAPRVELTRENGNYRGEFVVAEGANTANIGFYTNNAMDETFNILKILYALLLRFQP